MNPPPSVLSAVLALSLLGSADPARADRLAVGPNHSCVVWKGAVYCWGVDGRGEIQCSTGGAVCSLARFGGPARVPCSLTASKVRGLPAGAKAVSAGISHSCAIVADAVHCWGGSNLAVAAGGAAPDGKPLLVSGLERAVSHIASGPDYNCAAQGVKVKCWGNARWRSVPPPEWKTFTPGAPFAPAPPPPTTDELRTPVEIPGLPATSSVVALAASGQRACAAYQDGSLWCWGESMLFGATQLLPPGSGVTDVSATESGMVAVIRGALHYWFSTSIAKAPVNMTVVPKLFPGLPPNDPVRTARIYMGGGCAALEAGAGAYCWGANPFGNLGVGTVDPKPAVPGPPPEGHAPAKVKDLIGDVLEVAVSETHACALRQQDVLCWGGNALGAVGTGIAKDAHSPEPVVGLED